jgi:hypothetical protein
MLRPSDMLSETVDYLTRLKAVLWLLNKLKLAQVTS